MTSRLLAKTRLGGVGVAGPVLVRLYAAGHAIAAPSGITAQLARRRARN
jgi:hypothetical protein